MESNLIPEIPRLSTFIFHLDDGTYYTVVAIKSKDGGYTLNIYKDKNIIHTEFLKWGIPPDYHAARELLLIHLNK